MPGQAAQAPLRWELPHWLGLLSKPRLLGLSDQLFSDAVRRLDATLRRRQGIFEFTEDPKCLLRLSLHRAEKETALSDSVVRRGEWVGELHLWNEHLPQISGGGPNILWGAGMRRSLRRSLASLATFVESDQTFSQVRFFHGELAFAPGKQLDHTRCLAAGLGFEVLSRPIASDPVGRIAALGKMMFLWGMVRTFNRGALRPMDRRSHPACFEYWIKRETLLQSRLQERSRGVCVETKR